MKKTTIIIATILLVLNLLFGFFLSSYKIFNVGFTSIIIILTGVFVYLLQTIKLKDAFAISLSFLFAFIGIIQFILGLVSKPTLTDNWCVIIAISLLAIECIVLIIGRLTSKSVQ